MFLQADGMVLAYCYVPPGQGSQVLALVRHVEGQTLGERESHLRVVVQPHHQHLATLCPGQGVVAPGPDVGDDAQLGLEVEPDQLRAEENCKAPPASSL